MRAAVRAVVPVPDLRAEAIARTVVYASLFEYPLTLAQLRESLLESIQTEADVLATYRGSRWLREHVWFEEGMFFPAGRRDLIAMRRRRERFSVAFVERHRRILQLICALPFVRLVAISGSLAHLNLEDGGDLDLFVITRGRRVWSVTVAIVLLAKLLRCRRTVCANFVVADTSLAVPQQDLFAANQIIHLKPIAGADAFCEFVAANPFVTDYYPNFTPRTDIAFPFAVARKAPRARRVVEWLLGGPSHVMEAICRRAYQSYLRRRSHAWRSPRQVTLDRNCVKLHTQSHRDPVLASFDAAVNETFGCDFAR